MILYGAQALQKSHLKKHQGPPPPWPRARQELSVFRSTYLYPVFEIHLRGQVTAHGLQQHGDTGDTLGRTIFSILCTLVA